MSFAAPDDINPFQAPRSGMGLDPVDLGLDPDAELVRRVHVGHEASVKSIGSLAVLVTVLFGILTVVMIMIALGFVGGDRPNAQAARIGAVVGGLVGLFLSTLFGAVGYGLIKLQTWARWTSVVLDILWILNHLGQFAFVAIAMPQAMSGPVVIGSLIGLLIGGYILYLLLAPKSAVVFSRSYKVVIASTPYVKYKTSMILKLFLALIVLVVVVGIIGAFLNARN